MKRQAYQHPELRDANDSIIQEGTYGKASPLVNSTNDGVLDYINNNLEALHDAQTAAGNAITTGGLTVSGKTTTGTLEASSATVSGQTTTGTLAAGDTTVTGSITTTGLTVTGETSVPTANEGNSSNAIASTEFVAKSISALVNGAPDQLNTLNELAKALGNDSNFASSVTAELAKKLNSTEAESTYATKTDVANISTGLTQAETRISTAETRISTLENKEIERVNSSGSNYIRYESGLQICWGYVSVNANTATNTTPFAYRGTVTITFPVAFNSTPFGVSNVDDGSPWWTTTARSITSTTMQVEASGNALSTKGVFWLAIGKWK